MATWSQHVLKVKVRDGSRLVLRTDLAEFKVIVATSFPMPCQGMLSASRYVSTPSPVPWDTPTSPHSPALSPASV